MTAASRRTVRNSLLGYASSIGTILVTFSATYVVTRKLGAESQGRLFLMVALNALLTSLGNLGLGNAIYAFVARSEELPGAMHRVALLAAGMFGTVTAVVFIGLSRLDILPSITMDLTMAAAVAAPFSIYGLYWTQLLIGLGRVQWSALGGLLLAIFSHGGLMAAVILGGREVHAAWSWVGGMLVGSIVLGALALRFCAGEPVSRGTTARIGRSISFGLQAYFGEVAGQIWTRLDAWILAYFAGPQVLGIYSVASMVAERYRLSVGPIRNALARDVAESTREDSWRVLVRTIWIVGLPLLAIGLLGGALSFAAFPVIFGTPFKAAALPFFILIVGSWFAALASFGAIFFVGQLRAPLTLSVISWSMVAVGFILCLALIPRWGMEGAASAAALTMIAGSLAVYWCSYLKVKAPSATVLRSEDRPAERPPSTP